MKKLLKKVLLIIQLFILGLFGRMEKGYGQSTALPDSLKRQLSYIAANTKDTPLRKAVKEAQAIYTGRTIDDSISKKLLIVDSFLVNKAELNRQIAVSYTKNLVQLFKELPPKQEHPHYAKSLNNLANLYADMGQYDKPLPLYEQALAIKKKVLGEEHPDYANSLNDLAILYAYMGQYDKALPLFEQALAIRKKVLGEDRPSYTSSLNNLANLYSNMGQYDKALPLYGQALVIKKKVLGEEHPNYANSLDNLAVLYYQMGQYDKALPLYEQALAIRKKVLGEEHPDYALSLNNLASLYSNMGQYVKALPLLEQGLAIRKKVLGEEHPDYAISLDNLAGLYSDMGQYDKALPLFEQDLAISKKVLGEEHPDYAISLNSLASLYYRMGQYDKAMPLYEQALAIRKKVLGEEHRDYAISLSNLASLHYQMGQHDKALPLYEQALAIRKKVLGEEHPDYANSLDNLAVSYYKMSQYDKALPFYEQSLAIRKKVLGAEHPDYARSLNNLASLYADVGQYDKALPLYEQALAIRKKVLGEEHRDYAISLNSLASLYEKMDNLTLASALFAEAATRTLKYLNQTYTTLSEGEKLTSLNDASAQFNDLPSLLFIQNTRSSSFIHQLYTSQLTLKGMVLEDQQTVLSSIRKSTDSTALKLYERWRFNKAFLGKQLLLRTVKRVSYMDSLQKVTNQMEQELSRRSATFHSVQQNHTLTSKDIAQKLHTGEAAVEFISFKLYRKKWTDSTLYAALILLPKDTTAHFIPLFEEKTLQHLLAFQKGGNTESTIGKLYPANSSTSTALSDSLYEFVWKPLEAYLKNVHTIYYAPTGILHRIAFQALKVDTTHLLLDKYQLNQVLSTRSIALLAVLAQHPKTASIWGDVKYSTTESIASSSHTRGLSSIDTTSSFDTTSVSAFNLYTLSDSRGLRGGGWNSLPYSKEEMQSIKGVLEKAGVAVNTISGSEATEEAFKALDGKSPQVLHLATHGFFLPIAKSQRSELEAGGGAFTVQQNPMFRSGLVLAGGNYTWEGGKAIPNKEDGILTAYELAQMDLSTTELVVLSACETALGDIEGSEGVMGMLRALKMAGVKQMVISLWNVPDRATMELMNLFYKNWLGGMTTRAALRAAQLTMKEVYSPYYWAGFVLVE
jgi:tetratricopeptide (TPR) repeat protein/CHAT domain-containing protein